MARNKVLLPDNAGEWLAGYLERRGIDAALYPGELGVLQWQRLKTAYRQHILQASRIEAVRQSDTGLIAEVERLTADNERITTYSDSLNENLHDQNKTIRALKAKIETIEGYQAQAAALLKSGSI